MPMLFTGLSIDRAHRLRRQGDLAHLAAHALARFSPYWRGRQLISGGAAAWLDASAASRLPGPQVLLGTGPDGAPLFALDLSALEAGEDGPDLGIEGAWGGLRAMAGQLPAEDAALLAYARALLLWRERTRFCGSCGAPLEITELGHVGRCGNQACGALHFPRTDPAVIVLVTDDDGRALLGRQPSWPAGMYSCLAGFVEPGETLEEAVAREVAEETGIRVEEAAYRGNQPWPFPSSLMVAFAARARGGDPEVDGDELEDARWFSRDEVAAAYREPSPALSLPWSGSIARRLIDEWIGSPPPPHRSGEGTAPTR